jgi:hypothetical protein
VEPSDVAEIVEAHGRFVVGEAGELMVELSDEETLEALSSALAQRFGDQVLMAP